MFDMVYTAFSYEREMIVCSFLQDFSRGKGSSLQSMSNAHTTFLLCGADNALYSNISNHNDIALQTVYDSDSDSDLTLFNNGGPTSTKGFSSLGPWENKLQR